MLCRQSSRHSHSLIWDTLPTPILPKFAKNYEFRIRVLFFSYQNSTCLNSLTKDKDDDSVSKMKINKSSMGYLHFISWYMNHFKFTCTRIICLLLNWWVMICSLFVRKLTLYIVFETSTKFEIFLKLYVGMCICTPRSTFNVGYHL